MTAIGITHTALQTKLHPFPEQYLAWGLSSVSVGHHKSFQHDWHKMVSPTNMSPQALSYASAMISCDGVQLHTQLVPAAELQMPLPPPRTARCPSVA